MEKLCEAMSESFMETYPDITVTVEYTGSGAGIESLTAGSIDIGNASRSLKDGEKEKGAVENVAAIDGIAVIVDKENAVADLTTQQLADIYTGNVTNWSELGGNDEAIVVIGRENGSGIRGAFEELLEIEDTCKYAQELDSTGGVLAIFAVCSITVYMIAKGTPALKEVGVLQLLFGTVWSPTASTASYGIAYIILSSIVGTACSILIGVPIALLTAVFLTEIANKTLASIVGSAVELLAAIPSVIYGLLGMMLLNSVMFRLEKLIFAGSTSHQFTGGSNMLSAVIVLAIMILPTVINISASSIRAVTKDLRAASLALGASKIQTIFKVTIPAAKSGILTGIVLGIGRALGEAMAINMVAGGSVNLPLPFHSVRFLTTQLVSEMGYAEGLHRQVLFTVGLVLYVFIMVINLILMKVRKEAANND